MDKWDVIERLARAVETLSARVTALERREIGASGVGSSPGGTFVQTGGMTVTLTQMVGDYRVQYVEITHSLSNPRCLAIAEGAPVCVAVDRYETNKVVLIAFADTKLTSAQQCTVRWWLIV